MSDTNQFDRTTNKGKEDGLFRECMVSIRKAHIRSNRVRTVLTVTGLFTDKKVYREVLSLFYVATKELELKLHEIAQQPSGKETCKELLALGYAFTKGYEQDLETLYGSKWKEDITKEVKPNPASKTYVEKIRAMTTAEEVAGGIFVLWGALIIGGGAVAMPRVKSLVGPNGIHVFESVTGPGREDRKNRFVQTWDSLADRDASSKRFERIVVSTKECMQCNNDLMSSVNRTPWWITYLVVAIVAIALYFPLRGILLGDSS